MAHALIARRTGRPMHAHPIPDAAIDQKPLVFELILDRERTLLELDVNEDRAFVVGASPHADVQVKRAGVPPVAFYIERRRNEAWLVPVYRRGNLRLDGTIVIAGCRLGRRARIEFAGVRLELEAVTSSGADQKALIGEEPPTELSESTRQSRLAYLQSLPDVDDRTLIDPAPAQRRTRSGTELVRCPPAAVLWRSEPAASALIAPSQGKPPQLWTLLAERPFETVLLVLIVASVMAGAAIIAAIVLRFSGPG
jgi:hypothetical protein